MNLVDAEADGHGTHVAGSICGAQSGEDAGDDDADGMAFQGKLAVFDFGDSDNFNALTTPDEVCSFIVLISLSFSYFMFPSFGAVFSPWFCFCLFGSQVLLCIKVTVLKSLYCRKRSWG